jgi:hypothetical protein
MSDFLTNLIERSLTPAPAIRPQLISIFEPPPINEGVIGSYHDQPERAVVEQLAGKMPDRVSEVESLWRTVPERTVTPGRDPSLPGSLEVSPSPAVSRNQERAGSGLPVEVETDPGEMKPRRDRKRKMADGSIASDAPAAAKKAPVELLAGHETELSQNAVPEPPARRNAYTTPEIHLIGLPEISNPDGNRRSSRRNVNLPPDDSLIAPPALESGEKGSSALTPASETKRAESPAAEEPITEKIFPRQQIQPAAMLRSALSRIPQSQARPAQATSEPSIHVTIGRVEVRATLPAPARPQPPRVSAPTMSLNEYLRKRAGEKRQ